LQVQGNQGAFPIVPTLPEKNWNGRTLNVLTCDDRVMGALMMPGRDQIGVGNAGFSSFVR
jgi:hypothetical protein